MTSTVFDLIQKGGAIMWPILFCSVIAVGVFLERLTFFYKNAAPIDPFLNGISNLLRQGKYEEALTRCDEAYGPAVKVVQAAILKRHLPKAELREVVQEVAQMQIPRLEAHIMVLSTIGQIAPLLGLLGTVLGMIGAFTKISQAMGAVLVTDLSQSIWEALIATASGLTIAIPAYVAYYFFTSRVHAVVTDMERCGMEVIQILSEPIKKDEQSAQT